MKSKPSISSSTRKQNGLLACSRLDKIAKDCRCQPKVHHQAIQSEDNLIKNSDSCVPTSYHGIGHSEVVGLADIFPDVPLPVTSPYLPEKDFSAPLELKECPWQELLSNFPVAGWEYTALPDLVRDDTDDNSTVLCDEKNCNSECFHVTNGSTVGPVGLSSQEDLEELVSSSVVGYEYMIPEMVPDATDGCMLLPLLEEIVEANKAKSIEEALVNSDDACLFLAIQDAMSSHQTMDHSSYEGLDYMECFDPELLMANFLDLPHVFPSYLPAPLLEEIVEANKAKSIEEALVNSDDACLFLAIQDAMPSHQTIDHSIYEGLDYMECFDPELLMPNFLELPQVFPSYLPASLPMQIGKRKPNTLVLDLDETLIHSSPEHSPDADFSIPVCVNMKKRIVYVRQRPHLHTFLERVAEMFEIIIFTASQSVYADQLLNILDPDNKIISQRFYREACVVLNGRYVKDLTVLGRDLAKVAIIDNTPEVFQLQVNNGIPIQSWFDDPTDCALLYMLPFLEILASADDVRPIVANRFKIQSGSSSARTLASWLLKSLAGTLVDYFFHLNMERFYFGDHVLPCFESGIPLLKQRLHQLPDSENIVVAFPDDGAWKRFYKQLQHLPMVICTKVREGDKRIVRLKEGNPAGCHVVIVDDLVQSGGTLIECQKVLAAHGAAKVSAYVTHGVFPKRSWERFIHSKDEGSASPFTYFWITDSCPLTVKAVENKAPFEVLSLAGSIAGALQI